MAPCLLFLLLHWLQFVVAAIWSTWLSPLIPAIGSPCWWNWGRLPYTRHFKCGARRNTYPDLQAINRFAKGKRHIVGTFVKLHAKNVLYGWRQKSNVCFFTCIGFNFPVSICSNIFNSTLLRMGRTWCVPLHHIWHDYIRWKVRWS